MPADSPSHSPVLTLIVPTRNRRAMAAEALASALEKLPFSCELLLSDNASTDDTPSLARDFPQVKYRRRESLLPMAEHWNLCVSEARGEFVKILCDDDWLVPGALTREVNALRGSSRLAAVASARCETGGGIERRVGFASAQSLTLEGRPLFSAMLTHENILGPPSAVTFRKSFFGGFPEGYVYAADWAAWILLAEKGAITFLPEIGLNFRLHAANLTSRFVEEGVDFLEVKALREECRARLPGPVAGLRLRGIISYRLLRRVMRYLARGRIGDLAGFFGRLYAYQRPSLCDQPLSRVSSRP